MKCTYKNILTILVASVFSFGSLSAFAQEAAVEENKSTNVTIDMGLDMYSSYIWRGLKFGEGIAVQPSVALTSNNFTLGAWSNITTGSSEAFQIHLYTAYKFPFGVTIGIRDYFGNKNVFGKNFENLGKTHSIEPSLTYIYEKLTFFGALMFFQNSAGDQAQDFYGEISYKFNLFDFAIGAGDGRYVTSPEWKTMGDFAVCNITLSKEKTIKITDSFSLPMKGAVTLNPYNERFYVYVGISL